MSKCHLVLSDSLQKLLQIKPRHHDNRRSLIETHVENHDQAVDVEKREHAQQRIF